MLDVVPVVLDVVVPASFFVEILDVAGVDAFASMGLVVTGVPASFSVQVLDVVAVDTFSWMGSVITGVVNAVALVPVAILLGVGMIVVTDQVALSVGSVAILGAALVAVIDLAVERGNEADPALEVRA